MEHLQLYRNGCDIIKDKPGSFLVFGDFKIDWKLIGDKNHSQFKQENSQLD